MSSEKQPTASPVDFGRSASPASGGLKQRNPQRAFIFNEPPINTVRRRGSFFSDTLSETHRSFRSSTDDLLLPRVKNMTSSETENTETTHWHSLPLGLALLPAIAGIFFKDGSAIITDITLLGLAAIFLNWALRLPWEWYHAAQATYVEEPAEPASFQPIVEDDEQDDPEPDIPASETTAMPPKDAQDPAQGDEFLSARRELRLHEVLALLACFVSPMLGAWLLHAIRAQLSRPSEGLVSNYNLTIFLLVAEVRPVSHLMKMIQRRTLYLQRQVSSTTTQPQSDEDAHTIADLSGRLEELEAHIADQAAGQSPGTPVASPEVSNTLIAKAVSQANADVRKSIHPELDALSRAMRRYEKRMTISAIQVEARLQDVETRLRDAVALAAAAQRNIDGQPRNFVMTLMNWISALIVIPVQLTFETLKLPAKSVHLGISWLRRALRLNNATPGQRGSRSSGKHSVVRQRPVLKKVKGQS